MENFLSDFMSVEKDEDKRERDAALALALESTSKELRKETKALSALLATPISDERSSSITGELKITRLALRALKAYEKAKEGPIREQFGVAPSKIDVLSAKRIKKKLQTNVIKGTCREEVQQGRTEETLKDAEAFLRVLNGYIENKRGKTEKGNFGERGLQTLFCRTLEGLCKAEIRQFEPLGNYEADVCLVESENKISILEIKKEDSVLDLAILQAALYAVQYCIENNRKCLHVNLAAISLPGMDARLGVFKFSLDEENNVIDPHLEYGKVFSWGMLENADLLFRYLISVPLEPLEFPSGEYLQNGGTRATRTS
eukprot:GHVO01049954.1.p1 GENE.GHVO01049954.1~~GHVO01049954.1.p1  ORF type:complete len:322 (-),score=42.37 GHVO01049954.1:662-1606(-)